MIQRQEVPPLSLNRDGYQIETVFVGRVLQRTGWILLHRDEYGHVRSVASGWRGDYEAARREAYDAMKLHKADLTARDVP